MAKSKSPPARRGRPPKDDALGDRVLVRFDSKTKGALDQYVKRSGAGGAATAIRIIVTEKLRDEGLLK